MVIRNVRATLRASGFALATGTAVYGHRVASWVRPSLDTWEVKAAVMQRWSDALLPILGVDLHEVVGAPPPREDGPYLIVANHRSPLDILVGLNRFSGCVLSHDGVAEWPILGDATKAVDTVFVDREDPKSGARAIREMRRRLKTGRNVIVFPEGNTFDGDEVRPFRKGAFVAARGLGVPLLPMGLAYPPGTEFTKESFGAHLWRMSGRPRTPVWVAYGKPRDVPKGEAQIEATREAVQELVDAAAAAREGA